MKKLTSREVEALAKKIAQELNDENKVVNAELRKQALKEFYTTNAGKYYKKLQSIEPDLVIDGYAFDRYVERNYRFKPTHYYHEISDAIVLASIDAKDLETLIKTVKTNLTK